MLVTPWTSRRAWTERICTRPPGDAGGTCTGAPLGVSIPPWGRAWARMWGPACFSLRGRLESPFVVVCAPLALGEGSTPETTEYEWCRKCFPGSPLRGPSACPHAAIALTVFNAPSCMKWKRTCFCPPMGSPGLTRHTVSLLVNGLGTEFSLTHLLCDNCSQHSLADTGTGCSDCFSFHYKYIHDKKS